MIMTVRGYIASLASIAFLCGAPNSAIAQAPAAPAAKAAPAKEAVKDPKAAAAPQAPQIPWIVNCASVTGQMACEAVQTLTIQKTGQLLLSVSVRMPPGSKTGAMMLHLPHGMFLPDGVALAIDGASGPKQAVQMCDQKGCYVGMPIEETFLKGLQTGKTLSVSFKSLEKKEITVPISLSGFKEAYAKLL